jgi:hypothetical protein
MPNASLIYLHRLLLTFVTDLDCQLEAFQLLVPVLEEQDRLRVLEVKRAKALLAASAAPPDDTVAALRAANIVRQHAHRIRRARVLFKGNSIVSLVSRFDQFFAAVFRLLLRNHPQRLSANTISMEETFNVASLDELRSRIVHLHVEEIMRQSHANQFRAIEPYLSKVDEPLLWGEFIEVTERRHLYVHTGGKISSQYLAVCKQHGVPLSPSLSERNVLSIDSPYMRHAVRVLSEMGFKIAQTAMRKEFPKDLEGADKSLLSLGMTLLQNEQLDLALVVFDYGSRLRPNQTANDNHRKMFLINKATALKLKGDQKRCLETLAAVDWSAAHPQFLIAVNVLRDNFDEAAKLMLLLFAGAQLTEKQLIEWPVFSEYRKSEVCKQAFKAFFKRELGIPN